PAAFGELIGRPADLPGWRVARTLRLDSQAAPGHSCETAAPPAWITHLMSDSTSRIPGSEAPAVAAARAANASLLGKKFVSKAYDRKAYATETSQGYSTAVGRGFELAITLAVMVGLGLLADR